MHIFGCKFSLRTDTGDTVPDRKNFDSLLWAIVTVFQVSNRMSSCVSVSPRTAACVAFSEVGPWRIQRRGMIHQGGPSVLASDGQVRVGLALHGLWELE